MAREQETIHHTITVEFEESCSFGEEDQMTNPEYTDEVVGQSVLNHHEVERKAIETAENEIWDDFDDLELVDVYVDEVQRDEDEWTVIVKADLTYTTQEDMWDDDSEEDRWEDESEWAE